MIRRLLITVPTVLVVGFTGCKQEEKRQVVPDIPYILAEQRDQPLFMEFVGEVLGRADIKIQSRVEGLITGVHFQEGKPVQQGQLLYTIDPLPYATRVDQAVSELRATESQLAKSESDLNRIRPLAEMHAVSKRELDAAEANFNAAKAMVDANRAAVENRQIELGYCRVTAPIAGIIGLSNVKTGDYVGKLSPNSLLNTISDVVGVRVRFSVSEMDLLRYQRNTQEFDSTLGAARVSEEVRLILSNDEEYEHPGKLDVADRSIDPATGALRVEATFPNPSGKLRPGQFARVKIKYATRSEALLVPQRAVLENQGLYHVVVIDESNTIGVKQVRVAERSGNLWVIESGLDRKDRIAVVGNMFIKPGTTVKPVPADTTAPNNK
jgi:membrane fusion protein (multidrug efflux system)